MEKYRKSFMQSDGESLSFERHIDVKCDLHIHFHMEIVLVEEGELAMQIDAKTYKISEGNAVFIRPFESHSFSSEKHNICKVMMFSSELIQPFFEFLKKNFTSECLFRVSPETKSIIDKILPDNIGSADLVDACSVLFPLCGDIRRGCTFMPGEREYYDIFLKALSAVNENIELCASLNQCAKVLGVHPVTLSKLFSANAGVSFNKYVNYLRCKKAASLLKKEDITASEAAYSAGYGSIRSFNRNFMKFFGMTPTEYKKSPRQSEFLNGLPVKYVR